MIKVTFLIRIIIAFLSKIVQVSLSFTGIIKETFYDIFLKVSSVCGANEEYSECGGHRCVNFCRDPTFSWRCRPACTPGCACKEGYLRDEDDSCVLPVDCSGKFLKKIKYTFIDFSLK